MQAIIMAGGQGTRLKELTKDLIPKSMIKINDKPLLEWQIQNLKENGIDDIIIVVGHLKDKIKDYFPNLQYFEEDEPLGTAGALIKMKHMLKNEFFVIYGDLFFDINFKRMIKFHHDHKAKGTLFIHPNSHPYDSNLIVLGDNNKVLDILPKHRNLLQWYHNITNSGIYLFNKSILNIFPDTNKIDLDDNILSRITDLYGYMSSEYVKDIGTPERLELVKNDLLYNLPQKRNLKNKQKAIFLDRDGTINADKGLIFKLNQFELFPWSAEAIKLINKSEYLAIIVTNQPVIARGLCTMPQLDQIHAKMETLLGVQGAYIDKLYYCPHHPDSGYPEERLEYKIKCNCRKPNIGMILKAVDEFNIDLSSSWIIGDRETDIQTGINANLKTILVGNNKCNITPTYKAIDIYNAIQIILGENNGH